VLLPLIEDRPAAPKRRRVHLKAVGASLFLAMMASPAPAEWPTPNDPAFDDFGDSNGFTALVFEEETDPPGHWA